MRHIVLLAKPDERGGPKQGSGPGDAADPEIFRYLP